MRDIKAYIIIVAAFLSLALFASYYSEKAPVTSNISDARAVSYNLDKAFVFAGEAVPMDNFDAKERLDRELLVNIYMQASTILNIKMASRYFPLIEKILAENDVPQDFKYLAVAESNLRTAVSPVGAKGVWQFMKPVAQQYGLEVNEQVDERYHIEKATQAACRLLKDNYRQFGSWLSAAAAYNYGGPRLAKDMAEQRAKTYYDLQLNEETSRYVSRLVAIKEIMENPTQYGFSIANDHLYNPLENYSTVQVSGSVANWGDFANQYGTSYRILKIYNPWLLTPMLSNPTNKTYLIKIPKR